MLNLEKYNKTIWRLNGIIILIASLGAIFFCLIVGYNLAQDIFRNREVHDIVNINEKTKNEEFLRLGYFTSLSGTSFFLVPLSSEESISESYYSKSSSSNSRNYLLFDSSSKESLWLFKNNESLILRFETIKEKTLTEPEINKSKTIGLTFEVVNKDTNNDKRLSTQDLVDLVYFDLKTKKMIPLVVGIDRNIGSEQSQDDELLIFYSKNGKSYFKTFRISTMTASEEKEIKLAQAI